MPRPAGFLAVHLKTSSPQLPSTLNSHQPSSHLPSSHLKTHRRNVSCTHVHGGPTLRVHSCRYAPSMAPQVLNSSPSCHGRQSCCNHQLTHFHHANHLSISTCPCPAIGLALPGTCQRSRPQRPYRLHLQRYPYVSLSIQSYIH